MKKRKIIIISCIILMMLLLFVPMRGLIAASEDDFVIQNGVLVRYNGKDKSPEIPSGIDTIAPGAFENCNIVKADIPGSVKVISEAAFHNCKKLESVHISDGVKELGNSAFADCELLNSINLPSSVQKIGMGIFANDKSLDSIKISENGNFFYNEGAIYDKNSERLIQYLPGFKASSYTMPFSVKSIAKYAFYGASNLQFIRVSNNVSVIPAYAFAGCANLKGVFLPESIKRVDDYAFYNCSSLNYLGTENSETLIASTALDGCNKVKTESGVSEGHALDKIDSYVEKEETVNDEAEVTVDPKNNLSGAVGVIHGGSVSIFDRIEADEDDNFEYLPGEIGNGQTSNGQVNIYFDKSSESIGTITPENAAEREKALEEYNKEKAKQEEKDRLEQKKALEDKLNSMKADAFVNWKEK